MRGCERVVALELTRKGFAFGVLEGEERLIDWGTRECGRDVARVLPALRSVGLRVRGRRRRAVPDGSLGADAHRARRGVGRDDRHLGGRVTEVAAPLGEETRARGRNPPGQRESGRGNPPQGAQVQGGRNGFEAATCSADRAATHCRARSRVSANARSRSGRRRCPELGAAIRRLRRRYGPGRHRGAALCPSL